MSKLWKMVSLGSVLLLAATLAVPLAAAEEIDLEEYIAVCPAQQYAVDVEVREMSCEPHQLNVTWQSPEIDPNCTIDHFNLTYKIKGNDTTKDAVPGPPASVSAELVLNKPDSLTVTWEEPDPRVCNIASYIVSWQAVSEEGAPQQLNTTATTATLTDLKPYQSYNVCVAAVTNAGAGNSTCDIGTTDQDVPEAPTNLTATTTTPESIWVVWTPPETPNGVITNYRLSWNCSGRSPDSAVVEPDVTEYNITGLSPCSECSVAVRAATVKGFGEASQQAEAASGKAPPPQPTDTSCSSQVSAHRIVVTWSDPDTFCSVSSYNISYTGNVLWSDEKEVNSLVIFANMIPLDNLTPWTHYNVCVAGVVSRELVGEQSCCDTITNEAAPGPPASFNATGTSSSSISVSWEEPLAANGVIDGYQLVVENDVREVENVTQYTINGLVKNSNYNLSLRAHNKAGYGTAAKTAATTQKSVNVGGIVAGVVCGLLLVAVGVAIFLKRDTLKNMMADKSAGGRLFSRFRKHSRGESVQEHAMSSTTTAVTRDDLRSHIAYLQEDTQKGLEEEFAQLKQQSPQFSTSAATMDGNKIKNRFGNVLPFDHSRVKLSAREGGPNSDYINANYIKDRAGKPCFIAAQGPNDHTIEDFWRMVWERKVHTVVMLTNLMEKGRVMCAKYWPGAGEAPLQCGKYVVRNLCETDDSLYVSRILEVTTGQQKRAVQHYHFLAWPDFGTPEREEDLLGFIARVRTTSSARDLTANPIVVHCRAGVGRTGTFIGLWNLIDTVNGGRRDIDVYQAVLAMRQNRPIMVQSLDQYLYLYKCIAAYIENPELWGDLTSDHVYENVGFEDPTYANVS
ncbi:phosphatidylinositol phosphatase PTPRQ-like isoform X2 [Penaeus japonicus]|uniref:phosphatidylinositol phosphatase PTPRQ-like isoform X2 n=1 Tax=Penaeus japonicus TaxID=27405 RepID=UPI001C70FBB8|nr:phosphatidylinositol phosphatase PTPRQ-like isoform X2 [Penaeus japonicus]